MDDDDDDDDDVFTDETERLVSKMVLIILGLRIKYIFWFFITK